MANVVVPANSVHSVINLGLTVKELRKEGKGVKYQFVPKEQEAFFWKNLLQYVDPDDKTLIILDMPHPENDTLKQIELEPWKAAVLYIPSELNAPNKEEREAMIDKGISVVPERETFECFLGDISTANEVWRNLGKILSMEEKPSNIDEKELAVAKGIIEESVQRPEAAVERIARDEINYFREIGSKDKEPDLIVRTDNKLLFIEAKQESPKIFGKLFETYVRNDVEPVAIHGAFAAILTIKPTFFTELTKGRIFDVRMRFGKGAVLSFREKVDKASIAYFAGVGYRPNLILQITEPKFVVPKTLRRQFLGGVTSQKVEGKKYKKRYHGLVNRFAGVEFISSNQIRVPSNAFENAIALLHRSGANYLFPEYME